MNAHIHVLSPKLINIYLQERETFDQIPGQAIKPAHFDKGHIYEKKFEAGEGLAIAFLWFDRTRGKE
ncbi:MAG: hypothetical protein KDI79_26180 [Anaerolineae bacterium]|nr:hypothetical protein [Anaerolineae bacterium]